jgi:uncharacterized membrane protein
MPTQTQSQSASVTVSKPPSTEGREFRRKAVQRDTGNQTARFFGWFSIGLGVAEILFPARLAKLIGTRPHPKTMRLMGVREIATGAGLLAARYPAAWMKARVAGDALDLALLGSAFGGRRTDRVRLATATAGIAAITAADAICSARLDAAQPAGSSISVETSMAVNRTPEECYAFWRKLENLGRFANDLEYVRATGEKTSHWKARLPGTNGLEWDEELTQDEPGTLIAWQSLPGGDVETSGSVRFEKRPEGKGTLIRVAMRFVPRIPGAMLAAGLLETITEKRLREDVRRYKSVIEAGEAPTTEGQPQGGKL